MANRLHLTMDDHIVSALNWVNRELRIAKRHLICRAIAVWSTQPTLKPWQPESKGIHTHISVELNLKDRDLIQAWCFQLNARPSQLVNSALSYWFEDCQFLDRVQSGAIAIAERDQIARSSRPIIPPKEEADLSLEEILRQQLAFYRRRGNLLRAAQIQRQLLAIGGAA